MDDVVNIVAMPPVRPESAVTQHLDIQSDK
jgi:hypothetical protein